VLEFDVEEVVDEVGLEVTEVCCTEQIVQSEVCLLDIQREIEIY